MGRAMDRLARLRAKGVIIDPEWDAMPIRQDKHSEEYDVSVKKVEEAKLKKKEIEKETPISYQTDNIIEIDEEAFFFSQGVKKDKSLQRYYQALAYDPDTSKNTPYVYGMDCNACCAMYFLQSWGLIPPNISRKEFEYLFTPLNPSSAVNAKINKAAYLPNPTPKSMVGIKVNGVLVKPIENLLYGIFPKSPNGEDGVISFLRGEDNAIFPHLADASVFLNKIVKRFYDLSDKNGYEILKKYHSGGINLFLDEKQLIRNCYKKLEDGFLNEEYFKLGATIFVGIYDYGKLFPAHYCLVVNAPTAYVMEMKNKTEIEFFVYPTDDPFYGKRSVFVPKMPFADITIWQNISKELRDKGFFTVFPNCAIGI